MTMKMQHWLILLVIILVAYLMGVKYPSLGNSALSSVGA